MRVPQVKLFCVRFASVGNNINFQKKKKNKRNNTNYIVLIAHIHPIRKIYMLIQGTHHAFRFPFSERNIQTLTLTICTICICMFMYTGKAITIYKWVPYTTSCVVGSMLLLIRIVDTMASVL